MLRKLFLLLLLLALLAAACTPKPFPTTPPAAPTTANSPQVVPNPSTDYCLQPTDDCKSSPVLISEVLAGVQGNNNLEFIELYNRSQQIVDLKGWALWYRMPTSQEDLFVYRWKDQALIPPQGHYLLAHLDEALEIAPDAEFEQSLNTSAGGLQLRQTNGSVLDALGWGKAPEGFFENQVAPALQNGLSLERLPGAAGGSFQDQDHNLNDFQLNQTPAPQNTGSPLVSAASGLEIHLEAPASVEPGSSFAYRLSVKNLLAEPARAVEVLLPLAEELILGPLPENVIIDEKNLLRWQVGDLQPEQQQTLEFSVQTPWTYLTAQASNYYAQAANIPLPAFGGPLRTRIEGGVIPIATARTLIGAELTIEGVATMYTGGYFAGSGNNKFYIQDETGGIQVQVFSGQGAVNVGVGARVQVRGKIELYRGAVEMVPLSVPEDVQVIQTQGQAPPAERIEIEAALSQPDVFPGRLLQVAGDITRVEEFSYSYEIDLFDQSGSTLTLYVDKETNINIEEFVPGMQLLATGLLEVRDTKTMLYPRLQSDLQEIVPPGLRAKLLAPTSVQPGEIFTVTFQAENRTAETLSAVEITATLPTSPLTTNYSLLSTGNNPTGVLENNQITWQIGELAPGAIAEVSAVFSAGPGAATANSLQTTDHCLQTTDCYLLFDHYGASSGSLRAAGPLRYTFIGAGVPIWAIQGTQNRSPYTGQRLATAGIVTAVFPELGGVWLQELTSDSDPATSAGLFVRLAAPGETELPLELAPGDQLRITGQVREPAGQTTLDVLPADVEIIARAQPAQQLPAAVELAPPSSLTEALPYFESLEGMLVQLSQPAVAVSPSSRYGEFVVVSADRFASGLTRMFQGQDNGSMIMVDDGSNLAYENGSQQAYRIATGDRVSGLFGPLAYTYGRYKIEPAAPIQIIPGSFTNAAAQNQPAAIQTHTAEQFSLMTWNVENLFDLRDPHPSDPPKPSLAQYQAEIAKVAAVIAAAGAPTIVAMQEVENIAILEDIAAHDLLSDYNYEAVLIEGSDSRGIDVGYLVRGSQAKVLDVQQRPAPEGLTSRPPLILTVEVRSGEQKTIVYVINNHFTSMSEGEAATEPRRNAQAAWNIKLVQELLADEPQAQIAVVGDLNSYLGSLPIQTLRDGGLQHVLDTLPETERYTYIYQGESQVLDHILLTPNLYGQIAIAQVFHINADYPLALVNDASLFHKSDHDPVLVIFNLP